MSRSSANRGGRSAARPTHTAAAADLLRLCRWSEAAYPRESCGLLLGRVLGSGGDPAGHEPGSGARELAVELVTLAHNLAGEADRYELDPGDLVAADTAARARGLEIVGVWHSHPDHPAVPSAEDRERAFGGWSQWILAVTRERAELPRCWRLSGGAPIEEGLSIVGCAAPRRSRSRSASARAAPTPPPDRA